MLTQDDADRVAVPEARLQVCNAASVRSGGHYVVYWMTAARRTGWNDALDRAVGLARGLGKPLLVVETLPSRRRWASDRHHAFAIQGMADNARHFERAGVSYYPYVETDSGDAGELVAAIAETACLVVADDFPIRSFAEDLETLAARIAVRMEKIDSNGLLPMRAASKAYPTAYAFRRFLQKVLPDHLVESPVANPLARLELPRPVPLPNRIRTRWPAVSAKLLKGDWSHLAALPIDHEVPVAEIPGGSRAARARLRAFLDCGLPRYHEDRNQPEQDVASGLSPYLHFGHISAHEVFREVAAWSQWSPGRLSAKATGKSTGWWGMPEPAESFLDELITWREAGFNFCSSRSDYDQYDSLPDWARQTLHRHAKDGREYVYSPSEFERAVTHDPLWNAAQGQLVREGRMHNYLRMLWGKKILQWSPGPEEALDVMIELNNKYALDGQDPNSYSGIFWVLGRYDRPWAPDRPVFGRVRYMSSENTMRKVRVKDYLRRYARGEK